MNRTIVVIATAIFIITTTPALAMQGHDSHGSSGGHDMGSGQQMDHVGHGDMGGTYKHHASMGGMEAEFQVMSLASMNMKTDEGDTHHIMVSLKGSEDGTPIKGAVGKIKVIGPDKAEQISPLKNYGGILAANFTFKKPGKYGVICMIKTQDKKEVFKFWYNRP
ncbi:hypothetical protein DSCO28_65020 [Desulfosarcina ovata subsp. sediminis]|uniref:YtkA-like domain-containing protein n=1 Tax=Desulfosarcina ovata subsp. sediminis TaxID=885957 RepID=A0A5K8A0K1_9BACT|nr:hypothetical protein [Desulfosarcina ovata]BBO85936.1 hypothetical protein DSCO28_65020 [Desulfosarcina ovata subsp. sediminis]